MLNVRFFSKIYRRFLLYIWKIRCIFPSKPLTTFLLNDGSRFDYHLKTAIGGSLFCGGFENQETEFLQQTLKPGSIFFDIGANGGFYTVIAAKQVGLKGHVYAFEPGQSELELLRHNISINNLNNVTIVECAVGNTTGTAQLAISCDGAMNSLAKTNHPWQCIERWQSVKIISLDNFIQEYGIKKVDFIKIDVEGAEKLVFEGANRILSSDQEIIVMFEAYELNVNSFGYSVQEFIENLINSGMYLYYLNKLNYLTRIYKYDSRFGKKIYNFIVTNKPFKLEH
ncbi:MAG: FkbM family methyltransferase [Coleofasciculus sp. D1-CHI-01]|uniref:FkbM family methyltransferase n=1 Tax=Coleofasciculus sp. D1-CHI-01 TaxID=3068482 RepID=UPI0032F4FBA8